MKKFTPYLILLLFIGSVINLNAQQIDSITVFPKNPVAPTDTVKIYIYTTFTSGGCAGSALFGQTGYKINASSLHCVGPLAVICHDVDTVILNPPHNIGTYTFSYVLSSGFGFPCTPGIVPDDMDTAYFTVSSFPPVDLPPTISPIENDTICNDDSTSYLAFTIGDEHIFSCVVSGKSDNQSLVPDSNITVTAGGFSYFVNSIPLPNQTGIANITVTVTDSSNQTDSTTFSLLVEDCSVGIEHFRRANVLLFPNPNSGVFTIQLDRPYEILEMEITNTIGKTVLNSNYRNTKEIRIDERLPAGLYLIKMQLDGVEEVRRIIVRE